MISKHLMPALLVGAAVIGAQNQAGLTARELFYAPAAPPVVSQQKKNTSPTVAKGSQQVAGSKKNATPPPNHTPPHQMPQAEAPVMLVTASYSGPRPLGLRYSILKLQNGSWEEVPTHSTFKSGDRIRVKVEANENGYLYIVARGSSGKWDTLFPQKEIREGDNRIESGEPQMLPNRRGAWSFDNNKGEEKVFLVLSRKPVSDLDQLMYDLNQNGKAAPTAPTKKTGAPKKAEETPAAPPKRVMLAQSIAPIDDALVGRLRSQMLTRDLVFETIDDTKSATAEKKEAAVYVVEKSGKPDARLVVDIKLQHD
ncbi:MAG TPA: DUF4384 domain-containing protein [Bryobacteraceae bacterium]|nr:DUF4384 domain-containing protein [Bryobacteraceae bacterium]